MSVFRSKTLAAVLIGCLFLFLILYFKGRPTDRALITQSSIGYVSRLLGDADVRPRGSLTFEKLRADSQLTGGELVVVHEASQVTLGFGQATIRLQPGARLVAERDSSKGSGAVVATLQSGDADILTSSPLFRLIKNGKEISQGSTASEPAPLVKGGKPAPHAGVVIAATQPLESPTPVQPPTARLNDETDATSKESLSNEEIRRAVAAQSGFYRRCYLTYLNRAQQSSPAGETITVGFVIANSGKVRDAKLVRSTVNDAVLTKCILETVERTPFRAFKASDIPVLEFPIELK